MRNSVACSTHLQVAWFLFLAPTSVSFAQQGPQPLIPGTVVTGQCAGHESEPGCVLPSVFGPTGLSLYVNPDQEFLRHYAHFIGSAQDTLNQSLGTAIATQLAILPIISPASGYTYEYDSSAGAFVRSTTTFGPIYTERAETIGRGKFYFGVSYQRFRFDKLDGIDLRTIPAVFRHLPGGPPPRPIYESDVIPSTNDISFHMDQTMFFGTVGLTDRVELSLAVPLVSTRMGAGSDDTLVRVSGPTFQPPEGGPPAPNPHRFTADPLSVRAFYGAQGSATGIGDITVRVKGNVLRSEKVRLALALDIRTPTGDARKLLGSGSTGIKPFLAISTGRRVSPHVNVGYQWNSSSILAGNITGTTTSEGPSGPLIQNGPATKGHLPSNFLFSVGTDVGLTSRFSLAFDYLGQTVFNAPRVFRTSFTTADISGGTGPLKLDDITGSKETITLNNAAAGLKYQIFGGLLLTADLLFRLDNKGLRQDVTPLIAISRTFGK